MPKAAVPIKLKVHNRRQAMMDPVTARAVENPRMMLSILARDAASPKCSRYCIWPTMVPLNSTASNSEPIHMGSPSQDMGPGLDRRMAR